MSQNDFNIANQGFPATRADINSALQALASTSAGATAPSTTYAYQLWYDTSTNLLKMRNADNDGFITLAAFDQTADEWELRTAVVQAVDSAGVVIKTDDGTTRVTIADSGNVTLANDLAVTGTVQSSNISATGSMASRNKIINGAMTIDQRNAGASVTNPGAAAVTYTLDRWSVRNATDAAVNVVQSTDAPNATLSNSIELDVTTADTSIAAGQVYTLQHRIEGFNVNDLGFGKAGSRSFTVSFWHKHTKTGTYCVGFTNSAGNRAYPAEYTQAVADTWEQAIVTVLVDTTGTWLLTNGLGLVVYFVVAAGSNFHGTAGAWAAANTFATSSQVNALDSTSNFFRITGVQLEAGDTATPFEHRSYGQELTLCQRYYWKGNLPVMRNFTGSTIAVSSSIGFPVTMRATPTVSIGSGTVEAAYTSAMSAYSSAGVASGAAYTPGIGIASAEL